MAPMNRVRELSEMLASLPWMDPHTHLDAKHLAARGLDDVLLYHMSVSDLYAAGCPNGARVEENRTEEEAQRRIAEAVPYIARVRNTSIAWGVRTILADLYDWREPIAADNWRVLHERIKERSGDPAWPREVVQRANIARLCTELWRGHDGSADDLLQYSLEWAFFSRTQWGQPDIPLYELERAWNAKQAGRPIPVSFDRSTAPPLGKVVRSTRDVEEAVAHYCALIPYGRVLSTATHLSTDIDYSDPDAAVMDAAIQRRDHATETERDIYASFITHRLLSRLQDHGDEIVFQFSLGAEPLPHETASRLSQRTIAQLAEIVARHPRLRFSCYLSSRHANQSLCTLARELPNLSLAGYWWHNFFPSAIRQVMQERLDMLPMNKQIGFFSDAYCVDWVYAKATLVRTLLAHVLAEKITLGQYSLDDCALIAKGILYDTAVELLGMEPGPASVSVPGTAG